MILCVTPNPALDRTLLLERFERGAVLRPQQVIVAAGGKGLNVARSLLALGSTARCTAPLGGHNGRLFADLAAQEGLQGDWTQVPGETRICTILVERDHESTGLYERGEPLEAADWARFQAQVVRSASTAQAVCLCGSLPPELPPQRFAELIAELRCSGVLTWVDTSGAALEAALTAQPRAIKVNGDEAGALLGMRIADVVSAQVATARIRAQGVGLVVISLGRLGAVLRNDAGCWLATPPAIQAVSAVGSGDALLAGLLHGFGAGFVAAEALRFAVACGAANAATAGAGRFHASDVEALLDATLVQELPSV